MKERPILFSGAMVRALLDGRKTQTRRVVKPQPPARTECVTTYHHPDPRPHFYAYGIGGKNPLSPEQKILDWAIPCPYGEPGDRLYVRETFVKIIGQSGGWIETDYQATYRHGDRLGDSLGVRKKWTPSIHMPRDASRILLEITSIRVERLADCSETDAIAEGICKTPAGFWSTYGRHDIDGTYNPLVSYRSLWESINGAGSWAANPWVWVVEFKRITDANVVRNLPHHRPEGSDSGKKLPEAERSGQ